MRYTGVTSRGIITPIFRQGDDLVPMICDSLLAAAENEGFRLQDRDVVGVTEAIVARTQGNYATVQQIAEDVRQKLGGEDMGIVFPIMSRNRFAIMLRAISMSCKKLYLQLSFVESGILIARGQFLEKLLPAEDLIGLGNDRYDIVTCFEKTLQDIGGKCRCPHENDPLSVLLHNINIIQYLLHFSGDLHIIRKRKIK